MEQWLRFKSSKLSSLGMTEEFDVETGAEAEAFAFANLDKPWRPGSEGFYIDALGHEEDLV